MSKSVEFHIIPLVQPSTNSQKIDIEKIREISKTSLDGFPEEDRAIAWLAMLGVYPEDPLKWNETKSSLKEEYWSLVPEELKNWHNTHIPNQMSSENFTMVTDKSLMALVHGDIVRTGRTIFFFPHAPIPNATPEPEDDFIFQFGGHVRRLERILYTFASFHKCLGYMQGYNELLSPMYYVLLRAFGVCDNDIDLVEALSFHMFQELLTKTDIWQLYMTSDASSIIFHNLNIFSNLLERHVPKAAKIIKDLNIHPLLYCYRWFNLMFSQEYDIPTLLGIWDSLFSRFDDLVNYVYYVGLGQIHVVESKLDPTNYGVTISALQNLDISDIKPVLAFSNKCWDKDHEVKSKFSFSNLFKKLNN